MKFFRSNGDRVPSHIEAMADDAKAGKVDRREFLALASAFGASTAMAYGMIGLAAPTRAHAQEAKSGGVMRIAMTIRQEAGAAEPERAWSGEPCLIGVVAEQCECARRRVDRPEPRVLEVVVERGDEARDAA